MGKIKRNAPCPCGSGKKYKKCCLDSEEEKSIKTIKNRSVYSQKKSSIINLDSLYAESDALDDLSNSVVDLIDMGKFDEAEDVCNELLRLYPDQIDGIERFAMLCEARGDYGKAVEYYKKAAEFAQAQKGFDVEYVDWALDKVKKLSH